MVCTVGTYNTVNLLRKGMLIGDGTTEHREAQLKVQSNLDYVVDHLVHVCFRAVFRKLGLDAIR